MDEIINPIKRSYISPTDILNVYSEHKTVCFVESSELKDAFSGLDFSCCYAGETTFNGAPTVEYNEFGEGMIPNFMCFG